MSNKFTWKLDSCGRYLITYKNKDIVNMHMIAKIMNIHYSELIVLIKQHGAYKQLDNKYYFKTQKDVIKVVNILNNRR